MGNLVDRFRFASHVIHEQVFTQRVGSGEVGFSAAHLRNFMHKADKVVILAPA